MRVFKLIGNEMQLLQDFRIGTQNGKCDNNIVHIPLQTAFAIQ
jgi:hypothetical protein